MAHGHEHRYETYDRAFAIGVSLNVAIVGVQAAFGVQANSLALLADAGHNLTDVLALLLAWGAATWGRRAPSGRRTYGWRRSSILAALANALALVVVTGGIAWEAMRRFGEPHPVEGGTIIAVAIVALALNGVAAAMFLTGRERDVNLRAAFLHLVADAAVSLGVAVTGVVILATGWSWVDPAASLLVALVILVGTWSVLREAFDLVMDAVPAGIEVEAVEAYLTSLPQVVDIHDLHVWGLSTTESALTVHVVLRESALNDDLLAELGEELHERFGIEHATIQLEQADHAHVCSLLVGRHAH